MIEAFICDFARTAIGRYGTTVGWRFVNARMKALYGVDSMPETGENVATDFKVSRDSQDAFAFRSQRRAARAQAAGVFAEQIVPISVPGAKGAPAQIVDRDEQLRPDTSLDGLAKLNPVARANGTVTAGNASTINDGAAVLLLASEAAVNKFGLTPRARVLATLCVGVGQGAALAVERV